MPCGEAVGGWHQRPLQLREAWLQLRRPHIGPDDPASLLARIGGMAELVLEVAFGRLIGHVHAAPSEVELPTVVDAAQAKFLVAAEEQRGPAVRTVLTQQANLPVPLAERDQVLSQQRDAQR